MLFLTLLVSLFACKNQWFGPCCTIPGGPNDAHHRKLADRLCPHIKEGWFARLELSQDSSDKHALLVLGGHRMPRLADKDVSNSLGFCPRPKAQQQQRRNPVTWVAFTVPTSFLALPKPTPRTLSTPTRLTPFLYTYTHLGAVPECLLSAPASVRLASSAAARALLRHQQQQHISPYYYQPQLRQGGV